MLKLGNLSFNGSDFLDSGFDLNLQRFFDHVQFFLIRSDNSLESI